MTVREVIKALCEECDMTLAQLAEDAGMSQGNLSRAISLKDGGGMSMRVDTLVRLIHETGGDLAVISPDNETYFIDGEKETDEGGLCFPNY